MKKIIAFALVIVLIFAALIFITSNQNKQQSEGNPFGKKNLYPETIEQLDNELYQNIILPEELEDKLESGEPVTVYFYSPRCEPCNITSPKLVPKAKEMGVDLVLYNVLEFEQGWRQYALEGTPEVIHYDNGAEVARITGGHEAETYGQFFEQVVLGE